MPQIQLEDRLFQAAQRRAAECGYASVDEYIADVLVDEISDCGPTENFDHLFTPERLAELDRISAEIKAGGKTYTTAEAEETLQKKRAEWLMNRASQ